MIFLRNGPFLSFVTMDMRSPLSFLLRVWETETSNLLTFPIFFKYWSIGMCWDQVLILEYFYVDCIPPILLKHLEQSLMNALVWLVGLVSLFNGISTFVVYLMPNPFS